MNLLKSVSRSAVAVFLATMVLVGCASVNPPDPVVVMPEFNTNDATYKNIDKSSNAGSDNKNDYRLSPDLQRFASLPPENNVQTILAQLYLYKTTWYRQSALYNDWGNDLSHGQFYSALLGGISALTKSPQGATIGVGSAGALGLISSHYQLSVQSANYKKGADAMQCLYNEISAIPSSVWTNLYFTDSGEFIFSKSDIQGAVETNDKQAASDGYDTLVDMIPQIRKNIDAIISNLRNAQQNVILAAPSSADIQNAIGAGITANTAATTNAAPVTKGVNTPPAAKQALNLQYSLLGTQTINAFTRQLGNKVDQVNSISSLSAIEIKRLLLLPAAMTNCTTLTGTAPGAAPQAPAPAAAPEAGAAAPAEKKKNAVKNPAPAPAPVPVPAP